MASFDFSSRYLLSVTFRSFWHAGFLLSFSCRYFVQTRRYTRWWCWIWGCEKVSASTQTQQLSCVAVERLLRLVHTKTNIHVKREWKTHRGFCLHHHRPIISQQNNHFMHTCVVWFIYSHNRHDVTSLDLVVSHTPTIQQDDVTLGPPLWVEEWLNTEPQTQFIENHCS